MQLAYSKYSVARGVYRVKTKTAVIVTALGLVVGGGGGLSLATFVTAGASPASTVVVTQNDLDNTSSSPAVVMNDGLGKWFMYNDSTDQIDNTLGSFVAGPDTPPNGQGSVAFTLGANPDDRKNIATFRFSGTPLSEITTMSYAAYSHSGVAGANESPYLNFNVDFDGTGAWQKRLVYVPSANMATVPQDTWNTYDVLDGGNALWTWSGYANAGNQWPDGNTAEYRTWNDILGSFSGVRLLPVGGWLGVRVGEPGPTGYTGNVDAFPLGTAAGVTTYDFEPVMLPGSKDACKGDGWKTLTNNQASPFKNQGSCVSFVASGGKSQH